MAISRRKPIKLLNWSKSPQNLPQKYWDYLFKTLGDLNGRGFSLNQSLDFCQILLPHYEQVFQAVKDGLGRGESLDCAMKALGISLAVQAQIFNAQKQGRLSQGFIAISQELQQIKKFRQSLLKVLVYPLVLLIFLISLLLGVRYFMLDQITSFVSQETFDSQLWVRCLIQFFVYLPQILVCLLSLLIITYAIYQLYLRRFPMMDRYRILVKLPVAKKLIRQFCSYKLSRDLGQFYGAGYSMQQTIHFLLSYPLDPLMTSIAQVLEEGYLAGYGLQEQLEGMGIFTEELPLIVKQGELTSQLAHQCQVYSDKMLEEFTQGILRKILWVQPILFLLIAAIIVAIYLLMLMPMLTMDGLSF